jgi:hypothetical protein
MLVFLDRYHSFLGESDFLMEFLTQGGLLVYEIEECEDVKDAIVDFVDHPRGPKAAIVAAFRYYNNPSGEQVRSSSPVRSPTYR